ESAIARLLQTVEHVLSGPSKGPVPQHVSLRINAHDPKVVVPEILAGLIPVGAGRGGGIRESAEDEAAINGLGQSPQPIIVGPAKASLPFHRRREDLLRRKPGLPGAKTHQQPDAEELRK